MRRFVFAVAVICLMSSLPFAEAQNPANGSSAEPITIAATDWPWWRGPTRDGVAAANQKPPTKWSATDNVLWQASIPGRGHGSPIVVGDQVFLATADHERQVQAVLCFHRQTGKLLWQTDVHQGGFETKGNKKSSLASSTPACDGRRVFINFLHAGAIYTTALDRDGNKLWQTKVTDYVIHQGYGSSPAVYQDLVIVSGDNKGGGAIAALERATGKIVWKVPRPKTPNYASPIILNVAGHDQLLFTGCDLVAGFDPSTGKKFWEIAGSTTECVTSTVTDGRLIFTSGGYPKNHLSAVRADGSGQVVWEKKTKVYVPSLIVRGEHLYGVLDNGIAVCWQCGTGTEVWRGQLGGTFSASPVLVGDYLYATSEAGRTFIFKADPAGFDLAHDNQLGDDVLATPAICGGRIYMRAALSANGRRQEMLYCIGARVEKKAVSIKQAKTHLDFLVGDELVTRYHVGPDFAKPIFWPVLAPNGASLTRSWPMAKDIPGESTDHIHQKSAWFCHGDVIPEGIELKHKIAGVAGVDFWSEAKGHGNIVCTNVEKPRTADGHAQVATRNEWRTADGVKIMDEKRVIHFHDFGTSRLLILDIDLEASVCPITFGDTKEGSMGIRINDEIRADKGRGTLRNAEDGKVGEKDCWGRRSAWTDYSGPIAGKVAGLALLADAKNPYPSYWHIRGYGLNAANPFGRAKSGFPDARDNKDLVRLAKGEHLKLRYGLVLHDGDATTGRVAEAYRRFVELRGGE